MVLVDTSVWIQHLKSSSPELVKLLLAGQVVTHDFVLGELSLAHFSKRDRDNIFERLHALEKIETSQYEDVYKFSLTHKLSGKGIGWVDSHLLHACTIHNIKLLSFDKNLAYLAKKL